MEQIKLAFLRTLVSILVTIGGLLFMAVSFVLAAAQFAIGISIIVVVLRALGVIN